MSRTTRKQKSATEQEYAVPLRGRKRRKDAPNSLQFLAHIEGTPEYDGRVRAANGIRWRVA